MTMRHWVIHPTILLLSMLWKKRHLFLMKFMECGLYTWGMRWVVPRIRFTWRHAKLPGWKYWRGRSVLRSGDIILTYSRWQLTSMCIPGKLTHAALCVGDDVGKDVAEMVCTGYRVVDFWDVCRASRVVILRCKDWAKDPEYTQEVIKQCKSFEGTPYDPRFGFGLKSLYCSELLWHSDFEKRVYVDTSDLMGLGRPHVSPQDYYEAKNVEIVWDSADEHRTGAAQ